MKRALATCAAIAGLVMACSSPRPSPQRGDWVFPIAHQRSVDARFAKAGAQLLTGFPASIDTESFRPGDRLLFGFEAFADDVVQRFYIEMRSEPDEDAEPRDLVLVCARGTGTLPSHDRTVLVRVYDEDLVLVDEQQSLVPTAVFENGLYGWVREKEGKRHDRLALPEGPRSRPPPAWLDHHFAWPASVKLLAAMSGNRAICDRLQQLSVWPSTFQQLGMLLGGLSFECDVPWARLVPQPIKELPGKLCYEVRLLLRQGRSPLLVGHAVVVPPVGPLAMSAGIVTLAGYRGDDPRRRFVARLLAMQQMPRAGDGER